MAATDTNQCEHEDWWRDGTGWHRCENVATEVRFVQSWASDGWTRRFIGTASEIRVCGEDAVYYSREPHADGDTEIVERFAQFA